MKMNLDFNLIFKWHCIHLRLPSFAMHDFEVHEVETSARTHTHRQTHRQSHWKPLYFPFIYRIVVVPVALSAWLTMTEWRRAQNRHDNAETVYSSLFAGLFAVVDCGYAVDFIIIIIIIVCGASAITFSILASCLRCFQLFNISGAVAAVATTATHATRWSWWLSIVQWADDVSFFVCQFSWGDLSVSKPTDNTYESSEIRIWKKKKEKKEAWNWKRTGFWYKMQTKQSDIAYRYSVTLTRTHEPLWLLGHGWMARNAVMNGIYNDWFETSTKEVGPQCRFISN